MMLATPSLARSESFTRSRMSPRVVKVSGTKSFSPSTEVFVPASKAVSNSEYAQRRNINLKTSQPFVLSQAPRGTPQSAANKNSGQESISERPSTSSGTSTLVDWNQAQWDNIRKNRESRDDTYFTLMKTRKQTDKIERSEIKADSFQMPTEPPTPDATPPRGPTPEESLTAEFVDMKEQNQNGSAIGMALGSPSHPPHTWESSPYRENANNQVRGTSQPNELVSPISSVTKQKQSKWKGFGSLFGRKGSKPSTFYQLDETPPSGNSPNLEQNAKFGNPTPPDSADSQLRGRANTTAKKPPKSVPKRSNTAPVEQKKGWIKQQKRKNQVSEVQVDGGPMLNVEIPSIQLDRYSVMFSGVLKQTGTESASSLLARRQATLDKLKTVNEAIAQQEREELEVQKKLRPRRATSPQPTKSPAFSLFPTTVGTPSHPIPRTPSPLDHPQPHNNGSNLFRSNTSPAALSPNRDTFHSDAESHIIMLDDGKTRLNGISSRAAIPKKTVQFSGKESTLMLSPQSIDSKELLSPAASSMTLSSSDEEDEEETYTHLPLKPKLQEPDWQIINSSKLESGTRPDPFQTEIAMISSLTTGASTGRGRSGTMTQPSATQSTLKTAQSSKLRSPTSEMQHPMSPLRLNPVPISPPGRTTQIPSIPSKSITPELLHKYSSSGSTTNSTSTNTNTSTSTESLRPARSIKEIRADMDKRQQILFRSAQRDAQREIERAKVQAELDQAERTLESAAEISIARQISISQRQRQLLMPIQTKGSMGHRKDAGLGSMGSINGSGSERSGGGLAEGLGSNRKNDALLLSSGGFNNLVPNASTTTPQANPAITESSFQSVESRTGTGAGAGAGVAGFVFNHYERPTGSTVRKNSAIKMGAMGMGAVKREISSGTPTIVEPEVKGKSFGHRYRSSERVVLDG